MRLSPFIIALFTASRLACGFANHAQSDEIAVTRDVEYARRDQTALTLHLLRPTTSPKKPQPCVVYLHGGGWEKGSKDSGLKLLAPLVKRGFVGATIGYRFSQEAPFPAQLFDCKAAVRFLRAHAEEFGIDPNRIGVWGQSAGGHLSALLGTTADVKDLEGPGPNLEQSSRVQAVVDFCGPSDFIYFFEQEDQNSYAAKAIKQLLGGEYPARADAARRASPVTHASADDAPTLIMHGDKDRTVSLKQSELLAAALDKAGVAVTLDVVAGADHVWPLEQDDSEKKVLAFFEQHLRARNF